jgi:hypothetical protein
MPSLQAWSMACLMIARFQKSAVSPTPLERSSLPERVRSRSGPPTISAATSRTRIWRASALLFPVVTSREQSRFRPIGDQYSCGNRRALGECRLATGLCLPVGRWGATRSAPPGLAGLTGLTSPSGPTIVAGTTGVTAGLASQRSAQHRQHEVTYVSPVMKGQGEWGVFNRCGFVLVVSGHLVGPHGPDSLDGPRTTAGLGSASWGCARLRSPNPQRGRSSPEGPVKSETGGTFRTRPPASGRATHEWSDCCRYRAQMSAVVESWEWPTTSGQPS